MALFMDLAETTKETRLLNFGNQFVTHVGNDVSSMEFNDFHSRMPTDLVGVAESFVQDNAAGSPRPSTVKVAWFAGPPTDVLNSS